MVFYNNYTNVLFLEMYHQSWFVVSPAHNHLVTGKDMSSTVGGKIPATDKCYSSSVDGYRVA